MSLTHLVIFLLVMPMSTHAADLEAGRDAYYRGDYTAAFAELQPLADHPVHGANLDPAIEVDPAGLDMLDNARPVAIEPDHGSIGGNEGLGHAPFPGTARMFDQVPVLAMHRQGHTRPGCRVDPFQVIPAGMAGDMDVVHLGINHSNPLLAEPVV